MSRNAVIKVLLVVAVPMTGFAYVAAEMMAPSEVVRVPSRETPAFLESEPPLDLRFEDEAPLVNATEPPVVKSKSKSKAKTKTKTAPAPRAEPANEPPPSPVVREVLVGPQTRQPKKSTVRMWGVHQPDTLLDEAAGRSPSELSRRYRGDDEGPRFDRLVVPRASVEVEEDD